MGAKLYLYNLYEYRDIYIYNIEDAANMRCFFCIRVSLLFSLVFLSFCWNDDNITFDVLLRFLIVISFLYFVQ